MNDKYVSLLENALCQQIILNLRMQAQEQKPEPKPVEPAQNEPEKKL